MCKVATIFGFDSLIIYGDSQVIIQWDKGKYNLQVMARNNWCYRTKSLLSSFSTLELRHIYSKENCDVGRLSKEALPEKEGVLMWLELENTSLVDQRLFNIFQI